VGEFGDKFRKTREGQEFSLDDVSHVTKIGVRMLRAIEEEHFDQLPGGVFNKGFIRAYAKHLGLNDEDAITDYLACLRQTQIAAGEGLEPQGSGSAKAATVRSGKIEAKKSGAKKSELNSSATQSEAAAPFEELPELQLPRAEHVRPRQRDFSGDSGPGMPWGIIGVAAVVLVLALLFWMRRSHGPNTASASTPASKAESAKLDFAKLEPAKLESARSAPTTTTPTKVAVATPKPSTTSPAGAPGSQPSQPATPSAATSSATVQASIGNTARENDGKNRANDLAVSTLSKTSPQLSANATAPLTLVIRAMETSWISVLADGQSVSHETLIAPAHTSVRASHEIVARIGNAAGVTFVWNGQEVPADGAESEVKTFVFDSTGMRVVSSTPAAQNR
jgi:cytoskeletal protein RodZ